MQAQRIARRGQTIAQENEEYTLHLDIPSRALRGSVNRALCGRGATTKNVQGAIARHVCGHSRQRGNPVLEASLAELPPPRSFPQLRSSEAKAVVSWEADYLLTLEAPGAATLRDGLMSKEQGSLSLAP